MEELLDEAEYYLRKLCHHELFGRGVYLVSLRDAGPKFFVKDTLAYTAPYLDLELRPMLEREGRWVGRGFASVFDTGNDWFQGPWRRARVQGISIHEVSHAIAEGYYKHWGDCSPEAAKLAPEPFGCGIACASLTDLETQRLSHHPGWLRVVLHAAFRARAFGFFPWDTLRIGGDVVGLSDGETYNPLLGDELWEREGEPLSAINDRPIPQALFDRYVVDWKTKN